MIDGLGGTIKCLTLNERVLRSFYYDVVSCLARIGQFFNIYVEFIFSSPQLLVNIFYEEKLSA